MRFALVATCLWFTLLLSVSELPAREAIRLATAPALSPDGATLAFAWRGDIWLVSSGGGVARPWSTHPGRDSQPHFSPDGTRIAFTSQRTGTRQVFVGHVSGGFATQVTFHSEGTSVAEWFPDGQSLLVEGQRDHSFVNPQRLFRVNVTKRAGEELLFDAAADDGAISPDGRKILFTREGVSWWRKGYRGSEASQIWLYDMSAGEFTKLVDQERGGCNPLWQPDGKAFYYVGAQNGSFNLWQRDLTSGKQRRLTDFSDDSVLMPCISRDGSTIVFRHLFDFYRLRPGSGKPPQRLDIYCDSDVEPEPVVRRTLESATEVSFSSDGLELAMIAGGNLWVMDTVLCEPRQITFSPEEERCPAFAPDGKSILFVSDTEGETDIWRATRADSHKYWWQNDRFVLQRLTQDAESKSDLQWSPTGEKVAFVKGRGDLWIMDPDGRNAHRLAGALEPSHLRVVARRQVAHLCRVRQRFQPRYLGAPGGRLPAAGKPLLPSEHRRQPRLVARRPDHRFHGTAARGGGGHLFRLPPEGGRRGRRPRSGRAAGRGETPQGAVAARGRRRGAGGRPGGVAGPVQPPRNRRARSRGR